MTKIDFGSLINFLLKALNCRGTKYLTFNGRFNKVHIMTCGISGATARAVFMLCIMHNTRCVCTVLDYIGRNGHSARQCTSRKTIVARAFIKFINESRDSHLISEKLTVILCDLSATSDRNQTFHIIVKAGLYALLSRSLVLFSFASADYVHLKSTGVCPP